MPPSLISKLRTVKTSASPGPTGAAGCVCPPSGVYAYELEIACPSARSLS